MTVFTSSSTMCAVSRLWRKFPAQVLNHGHDSSWACSTLMRMSAANRNCKLVKPGYRFSWLLSVISHQCLHQCLHSKISLTRSMQRPHSRTAGFNRRRQFRKCAIQVPARNTWIKKWTEGHVLTFLQFVWIHLEHLSRKPVTLICFPRLMPGTKWLRMMQHPINKKSLLS